MFFFIKSFARQDTYVSTNYIEPLKEPTVLIYNSCMFSHSVLSVVKGTSASFSLHKLVDIKLTLYLSVS